MKPEYEEIMTATSHITGKKINRFTHIHQSVDDLVKKSKMGRLLGSLTGCCFQRCVGMDALNALSMTTYDIDAKHGTEYNKRFLKYLEYVQENDLVCDGAMTDPKGDRSLPPHQQADPDLFLRVVEERKDGIVVRGAKAHQTGAVNSHEVIVMPTISMREEDRDYAVSFAVPSDTKGITYIMGRQSCDTRKLESGHHRPGQRRLRRPRGAHRVRRRVRAVGAGLHVQGARLLRRSWWSSSPPTTGRATPARWGWATC